MAKILYTAHAHVTGGRVHGHGRSSDGQLEVDLRVPKEMGGTGDGTNPEALFAVAACFEGALGTVARRRRLEAGDVTIDSAVSLLPTGDGGFTLAVTLDVTLPSVDDRETAADPRGVADWSRVAYPPSHRTVHAVLPHTAHRHRSPADIRSRGTDRSVEAMRPRPGRALALRWSAQRAVRRTTGISRSVFS
jgi:lipoyl-dependent peroxiredoxin